MLALPCQLPSSAAPASRLYTGFPGRHDGAEQTWTRLAVTMAASPVKGKLWPCGGGCSQHTVISSLRSTDLKTCEWKENGSYLARSNRWLCMTFVNLGNPGRTFLLFLVPYNKPRFTVTCKLVDSGLL